MTTTTLTHDDLETLRGSDVYGRDDDKIGSLDQIYLDNITGEPEFISVKTGLFGMRSSLVPLAQATRRSDGSLEVAYDKATVKDAPSIEADQELSEHEEQELYRHYGLSYGAAGEQRDDVELDASGTTGVAGTTARDTSGPETDSAMTRSEEELDVGTRRQEQSRVRLRKHIVTDTETVTVPVEREVARLEREPITDENRDEALEGPDLSEEEAEVTLSEEEVVVGKHAVPKERVRLDKDVVTEEESVTEEVAREEIDVDGPVEGGTSGR